MLKLKVPELRAVTVGFGLRLVPDPVVYGLLPGLGVGAEGCGGVRLAG